MPWATETSSVPAGHPKNTKCSGKNNTAERPLNASDMITFPNAKVNLGLYVTERRPDGYHNLETIFCPVGLADALEILPSASFAFHTSGLDTGGDAEANLVVRAFRLLQQEFHLPLVKIHLHKVIPSGAGLGGGSSDAAFTLKMVNELFQLGLSTEQLESYAATLGADCPFFIRNKPALATGRGEVLTPFLIDLSGFQTVIVKPPFMVSTAMAYGLVTPRIPQYHPWETLLLPPEKWQGLLKNDFEIPVFAKFPEIEAIKTAMITHGATYASMSGSGSAVFGLFRHIPEKLLSLFPEDHFVFCGENL